jgi:hypothetical protein
MKAQLMAGAASFAHLLGRPATAAKRAENDRPDEEKDSDTASSDALVQGDDETDEDFEKRKAAAEEDKKRDDEDDDEHKARVKANKARRAKRARAEENGDEDEDGDDDSDGADMRNRSAGAARLRERARCAAIFADKAAGRNPALAATLAFCTSLPRSEAVAVLRAGGTPAATTPRSTLDRRMASIVVPPVAASGARTPASGGQASAFEQATAITAAGMKRRGESQEAIAAYVASRQQA